MCSYTSEQKAQVIADLLAGFSINQCVQKYEIPRGTISRWSAGIGNRSEACEAERSTKKEQTGELVIGILDANLIKLREMLNTIDDAYLRKQPASEFAILYGVIADKSFRIMDSIARREQADRDEVEDGFTNSLEPTVNEAWAEPIETDESETQD